MRNSLASPTITQSIPKNERNCAVFTLSRATFCQLLGVVVDLSAVGVSQAHRPFGVGCGVIMDFPWWKRSCCRVGGHQHWEQQRDIPDESSITEASCCNSMKKKSSKKFKININK